MFGAVCLLVDRWWGQIKYLQPYTNPAEMPCWRLYPSVVVTVDNNKWCVCDIGVRLVVASQIRRHAVSTRVGRLHLPDIRPYQAENKNCLKYRQALF